MSLTVVSIAYPLVPIGHDTVGGTEQIVAMLDAALTRAGHHSIVVGAEGSKVSGTLVPTPSLGPGPADEETWEQAYANHRDALQEALEEFPVDVVHMHGIDFHTYLPDPALPVLATLHLPPHNYPEDVGRPDRPLTLLNCVSHFSRRLYPADAPMTVVPNGVPLDRFRPAPVKDDFVLALGRVCPEKGFHLALDAAREAGLPLFLGGRVPPFPEHQRYFDDEIRPRLDDDRRFLGPLPLSLRTELLARARCVVVPSLVDETSSLVAIEALASGTPVVARPVGALPENVEDGRTGLLVDDVKAMASAMRDAALLSSRECRRVACARFSAERMVYRYFDLYDSLASLEDRGVEWREEREYDAVGVPAY